MSNLVVGEDENDNEQSHKSKIMMVHALVMLDILSFLRRYFLEAQLIITQPVEQITMQHLQPTTTDF